MLNRTSFAEFLDERGLAWVLGNLGLDKQVEQSVHNDALDQCLLRRRRKTTDVGAHRVQHLCVVDMIDQFIGTSFEEICQHCLEPEYVFQSLGRVKL